MKKSIDTKLALYPTPATIVGVMNGGKPTWTLVAHIGIIGHDRILIPIITSSRIGTQEINYTHSLLDFPADPCYNIENRARELKILRKE